MATDGLYVVWWRPFGRPLPWNLMCDEPKDRATTENLAHYVRAHTGVETFVELVHSPAPSPGTDTMYEIVRQHWAVKYGD